MKVSQLFPGVSLQAALPAALAAAAVSGLDYDSRRIQPGYLFFAFPGAKADGRAFARQALERGALAVVSELPAPADFPGPWIQAVHGREALAVASREFHGRPDTRLRLTGVTGTNGKTTTVFLIDAILRAAGFTTGLMGTIEYRIGARVLPAVNTTPESLDIMRFLAEAEQAGGTHVTMEVSSHALELRRIYGIAYHTAVFTNLTRDHLDYHGTMEAYEQAKLRLFTELLPADGVAVINGDSPSAATFVDAARSRGTKVPVVEPIPTSAYPTPAKRPANSRLDCARLAATFGVRLPPWRDSVTRTVETILRA